MTEGQPTLTSKSIGQMRCALVAGLFAMALLVVPSPARADAAGGEDINSFVARCRAYAREADCWETIREDITRLRTMRQNRDYCMPQAWGAPTGELSSYPTGLLANIAERLSAARFGHSGAPYEVVLVRTLAQLFPCRRR